MGTLKATSGLVVIIDLDAFGNTSEYFEAEFVRINWCVGEVVFVAFEALSICQIS